MRNFTAGHCKFERSNNVYIGAFNGRKSENMCFLYEKKTLLLLPEYRKLWTFESIRQKLMVIEEENEKERREGIEWEENRDDMTKLQNEQNIHY